MPGTYGESGARAYNRDLGAEPPARSRAVIMVRGPKPPEAKRFSALECPKDATFLALSESFAVTAKSKLALCMVAQLPESQCCGPLKTFREREVQLPPVTLVCTIGMIMHGIFRLYEVE